MATKRLDTVVGRSLPMIVALLWLAPVGCQRAAPTIPVGKELCATPGFSIVRLPDKPEPKTWGFSTEETNTIHNVLAETVLNVVAYKWGVYPGRIDLRTPLPEGTYNMNITSKGPSDLDAQIAFAQAFREAFHLRFHWENQAKSVLVLASVSKKLPVGLVASTQDRQTRNTVAAGLAFTRYSMDELCDWMEWKMENTPVLNESGLSGPYNFVLNDDVMFDPGTIPKHVGELGLEIRNETRRLRVLVVEHD